MMAEKACELQQDPCAEEEEEEEEVITCAEELPYLDLQEYIYDCARKLYTELSGQSYHIVVVSNAIEQHAELLLANDLQLQEIRIVGATIPVRKTTKESTETYDSNREALEMLLLECNRLLGQQKPSYMVPSFQTLRGKILENARECFPEIVEDYMYGRITQTVMKRDDKYRLVPRQVPFTIPESEIFEIAIASGSEGTLQASLVYGSHEDLKFAMRGEGRETYLEAINALFEAIVQRLGDINEAGRVLATGSKTVAPSWAKAAPLRIDSPMLGFEEGRIHEAQGEMQVKYDQEVLVDSLGRR